MKYALTLLLLFAGCAGARHEGTTATFLEGEDLVRITDDMAMKIPADPDVQAAVAREGPLTIVVLPVRNRMAGEVLPRGQADAFTARVRILLSKHAPDRFVWIMNRDAYYQLRATELDKFDLGPNPDAMRPRYALSATFDSLPSGSPQRRTQYYLCTYELTDLDGRNILWTDKYELKKTAVRGFLD